MRNAITTERYPDSAVVRHIFIDGKRIPSGNYLICCWLGNYNQAHKTNIKPAQITDEMVKQFVTDYQAGKRF